MTVSTNSSTWTFEGYRNYTTICYVWKNTSAQISVYLAQFLKPGWTQHLRLVCDKTSFKRFKKTFTFRYYIEEGERAYAYLLLPDQNWEKELQKVIRICDGLMPISDEIKYLTAEAFDLKIYKLHAYFLSNLFNTIRNSLKGIVTFKLSLYRWKYTRRRTVPKYLQQKILCLLIRPEVDWQVFLAHYKWAVQKINRKEAPSTLFWCTIL